MSEYRSGSFTSGYEEFWRKSNDFADEAIRSSSVVLDTNAVLNLYRMKPSARNEYLQVLEKVSDRIWIPRQVADEFHRNRLSSVANYQNSLAEKYEAILEAAKVLKDSLRDFYRLHSLADGRSSDYLAPLNELISGVTDSIAKEVAEYDLNPGSLLSDDPILAKLAVLFDGKVGERLPEEEEAEVKKEALRRGTEKVPPGYIDIKKKGEAGYGDFLIWTEMMGNAKTTKKGVLFVSTDTKEDWIRSQCGMPIGPRPELVREMRETAGVSYHQVPLSIFLTRAAEVFDVEVSQGTIDQANESASETDKARRHILKRREQLTDLDRRIAEVQGMQDAFESDRDAAIAAKSAAENDLDGENGPEYRKAMYREVDVAEARLAQIEQQLAGIRNGLGSLKAQRDSFATEIQVLERWAI
ncbi:PIN-like domain-containing protein [Streptomyces sp. NBC_01613]|uniref:PIN-like domain-containing protein n=1 Tax=Streptomyces sp. NBC_01613 TaxID=2975896 RepID=UPI00386C857F